MSKKLSKEAKYNLRVGFGSLVSNQSCIEAGKSFPWWSAILIGLVGTFLPMIPIMVNIAKTNGETFINGSYNYSFEKNASIANVQLHSEGYEFEVGEDHFLTYYKDGEKADQTISTELTSYVSEANNQYVIKTYWLADTTEKNIDKQYSEIIAKQYVIGTTTEKADTDPEGTTYYIPNYIFYYKEGHSLYLAKTNSTSAANKFTGDFINVKPGKLVERLLTVEGYEIPADYNDMDVKYMEGVFNNYKTFYNESYLDIKSKSLIYTTFIYWGIYLGLALFLGLLIFLLTRGKRNFNNYLKWYNCMCISAWSTFTPGLLSMILGFIMSNFAIMFFILLMGVRIMWLSMKQLSPTYQQA